MYDDGRRTKYAKRRILQLGQTGPVQRRCGAETTSVFQSPITAAQVSGTRSQG